MLKDSTASESPLTSESSASFSSSGRLRIGAVRTWQFHQQEWVFEHPMYALLNIAVGDA